MIANHPFSPTFGDELHCVRCGWLESEHASELKEPPSESVKVETQKTGHASSFTKVKILKFDNGAWQAWTVDNRYVCESSAWIEPKIGESLANAELIAEAFNVATETGLTPRQLQKARDESYGLGVTAGKFEALKYTPDERERYGKWAAEGEMCSLLAAQKKELLTACQFFFGAIESGELVRDISRDSQLDWTRRMMLFTVNLGKAQLAIANATKTDSASEAGSVGEGNEVR